MLQQLFKIKAFDFDFDCQAEQMHTLTKVFMNGNWIGFTENASKLFHNILESRRADLLPIELSVAHDIIQQEIK